MRSGKHGGGGGDPPDREMRRDLVGGGKKGEHKPVSLSGVAVRLPVTPPLLSSFPPRVAPVTSVCEMPRHRRPPPPPPTLAHFSWWGSGGGGGSFSLVLSHKCQICRHGR